ncbi:nuclear fragile X mental retardation-interacting protein 1-domain-containing protein [Lipomyces tetrasporus]
MGDYIFGPPPPPPPKFSSSPQQQQQQTTSWHTHGPPRHNNRNYGHQRHAPYVPYDQTGSNLQRQGQRSKGQYHNGNTNGGHTGSNRGGYLPPIPMNNTYGHMSQLGGQPYAGMAYAAPLNQSHPSMQLFPQPVVTPAPSIVPQPSARNSYNLNLISSPTTSGQLDGSGMGYYGQPQAQNNLFYGNHNVAEEEDDVDEEATLGSRRTMSTSTAVVTIPGTAISLQTEEDIVKWISERKKNWPTAKRIELKQEELQRKKAEEEEPRKVKEKLQEEQSKQKNEELSKRNICKFFAKTGRCNRGSTCAFSHERSANAFIATKKYKRFVKPQKMPLFKRLVQNDWDKENGKVLDFISYLVDIGVVSKSKAV